MRYGLAQFKLGRPYDRAGYHVSVCREPAVNAWTAGESLFVVSKVWNDVIFEGEAAVEAQVERSLEAMQLDYFDLYLVHWPVPGKHSEAYRALEKLQKANKICSIGAAGAPPL